MNIIEAHQRMHGVGNASRITPQLWLGNYLSSQDEEFIRQQNIAVVVNCSKDLPFLNLDGVYKYRVPVHDNLEMDEILSMEQYLKKILPLIHEHHEKGRVILIHCAAGVQRSAIVTLSYLHQYHIKDAQKAYDLVKSRRSVTFSPYMNFKVAFNRYFKYM
jgi:protein tyrosine phosphatase